MVSAWDIHIEELTWRCEDVVSKCYIIPGDQHQARASNPLPDEIRKARTFEERRQRFNSVFEKSDAFTWIVQSLLLPPSDTIARMVNTELDFIDDEMND
jgi:hypothetical protein